MNLGHASYGLKHVVENYTDDALGKHNYVSNGALCTAAIEEGYEYIIPYGDWNIYFNLSYTSENHDCIRDKCELDSGGYATPIDQEDYDHKVNYSELKHLGFLIHRPSLQIIIANGL